MNSIKTINRSVPAIADGAYSYFADSVNQASTVADNVNTQITDALTTLPTALQNLKAVEAYAANIAKVNAAEQNGDIDAETAAAGRKQLVERLNEGATTVATSFNNSANDLSESATRLTGYSDKLHVRVEDAKSTETSNHERAKEDVDRESARVNTLQARYDTLKEAVDEKRVPAPIYGARYSRQD